MNVLQFFVLVFVGWPAALGSAALSFVGITSRKPRLVFAGVILGTPFLLYLAATPRFQIVAPVTLLLYLTSAILLKRKGNRVLAGLFAAPFALLLVWVAWLEIGRAHV